MPFLTVLFGLNNHVFHSLVKTKHSQIKPVYSFFSVNQRNEDGIDDDAEKDDGKNNVPDE